MIRRIKKYSALLLMMGGLIAAIIALLNMIQGHQQLLPVFIDLALATIGYLWMQQQEKDYIPADLSKAIKIKELARDIYHSYGSEGEFLITRKVSVDGSQVFIRLGRYRWLRFHYHNETLVYSEGKDDAEKVLLAWQAELVLLLLEEATREMSNQGGHIHSL